MIRLLSVQPVAERGGSDHALLRMVRSLPPAEFACHIALPGPSPLARDFAAAGATLHVVPMRRISMSHGAGAWAAYAAGWPVAVARLTRLVRDLDVDVVHSNSLHSWYGWAAAFLARRSHVWHAREIVVQSPAALRVERVLAKRFATTVVAMSCAVADQLDPANVEVVYETADPLEFRPGRAGGFRAREGIADDVPLAGSAGRVDSWKGFDVLIDAFEQVCATRPDAHLVLAGDAVPGKEPLARALGERARSLPNVHWLGPRGDMPALFADLDVFVLPSTEPEPYGLVVVEALASGTPVVVTDAGGPPEILRRAGSRAGVAVPAHDPRALAAAIGDALPASSSTVLRAARRSLQPSRETTRFAEIFRRAAGTLARS